MLFSTSGAFFDFLEAVPEGNGVHFMQTTQTGKFISYKDLAYAATELATLLSDFGMVPGDRVVFPFDTSPVTVTTFLAILKLGAVPLSVKPRNAAPEGWNDFVAKVVEKHSASYLYSPETMGLGTVKSITRSESRTIDFEHILFLVEKRLLENRLAIEEFEGGDVALIQFSSGSTSFPKGVVVTPRELFLQLDMIVKQDGRRMDSVCVSWLPLYHDMGLVGGLLSNFVTGNTLHLFSPQIFILDPVAWLAYAAKVGADVVPLPNFGLDFILKRYHRMNEAKREALALDLSSLESIYCGSEPIAPETARDFIETFSKVGLPKTALMPCYGMAEAVLKVISRGKGQSMKFAPRPGAAGEIISVGRPVGDFEVIILGEDGKELFANEEGELAVKGGSLTGGYDRPETPFLDKNGYYRTGDLGFKDDDGEFYISGRAGDRIKIRGQSFYGHDLELVAQGVPGVKYGRACAFEAPGRPGQAVLLVEPQDLSAVKSRDKVAAAVRRAVGEKVGIVLGEGDVIVVAPGTIKKTSSGKLMRRAMAGKLQALRPVTAPHYLMRTAVRGVLRALYLAKMKLDL